MKKLHSITLFLLFLKSLQINIKTSANKTDLSTNSTSEKKMDHALAYRIIHLIANRLNFLCKDMEVYAIFSETAYCKPEFGQIFCMLLFKMNVSLDVKDEEGLTLLHRAVLYNNRELIEFLLNVEANPNITDKDKESPLIIAAKHRHLEAMKVLIQHSANVNLADKDGNTPIIWLVKKYKRRESKTIIEMLSSIVKAGADLNIPNNEQKTPLCIAAEKGHYKLVEYLLTSGANAEIAAITQTKNSDIAFLIAKKL